MSQPVILSQIPAPNETGVVLGHLVEMTFDQAIDPATLNDSTFSLLFQGDSLVFDADNLSLKSGRPATQKQHITGKFAFPSPARAVFTPDSPLRPKTEYTVIIAGGSSVVAQNVVKNAGGEKLKQSYTWRFTTSDLTALAGSPQLVMSPLVEDAPELTSDMIQVIPRRRLGVDFTDAIELWFPDEIDPTSIDPSYFGELLTPADANPFNDILVSIEAPNNDPMVALPQNLTYRVSVQGNVLRIEFQGQEN